MPGEPGKYTVAAIRRCGREQPKARLDAALLTGSPELKPRPASGGLVRAICRTLRVHLAHAVALAMLDVRHAAGGVSRMSPEQRAAEAVYLSAIARRLAEFLLSEDDIAETVKECWPIV